MTNDFGDGFPRCDLRLWTGCRVAVPVRSIILGDRCSSTSNEQRTPCDPGAPTSTFRAWHYSTRPTEPMASGKAWRHWANATWSETLLPRASRLTSTCTEAVTAQQRTHVWREAIDTSSTASRGTSLQSTSPAPIASSSSPPPTSLTSWSTTRTSCPLTARRSRCGCPRVLTICPVRLSQLGTRSGSTSEADRRANDSGDGCPQTPAVGAVDLLARSGARTQLSCPRISADPPRLATPISPRSAQFLSVARHRAWLAASPAND